MRTRTGKMAKAAWLGGRASGVAVIATAAVLAPMSPAWAAGSGVTKDGVSNINQVGEPEIPLCLPATATTITLENFGIFNSNPTAVNTTAKFRSTANYFFGPTGTFSDKFCTVPVAVVGELDVSGGATCNGPAGAAEYRRVGSDYVIRTTSPITCTRAASANETSNLTFTGTQLACGGPVDPCASGPEFSGDYVQG